MTKLVTKNSKTATPWGKAQTSTTYVRGVISYTTASHGGFHLSPIPNLQVAEGWRNTAGWYEEDCEWAIVALTFPTLFTADQRRQALAIAKDLYPDQVTSVLGIRVLPSESRTLRQRAFEVAYRDQWVTVSVVGKDPKVPVEFVGVLAVLGGTREGTTRAAGRWFLVPEKEYDNRPEFGLVIDLTRHSEISPLR